MKSSPTEHLTIKVFSPYEVFFEGTGVSLSAQNQVGPFDVLYGHSNFFSLLTDGDVTIDTGTRKITVTISSGLIKVTHNEVMLFANV